MVVQLVVAAGNRAGQIIPILTEKFIIGRAADCNIKSQSELISRYHCAILIGDDVVVRDLGSRNGVSHNGNKVSAEQKLHNGDKLSIGPLEFYVHIITDGDVHEHFPANGANNHDMSNDDATPAGLHNSTILLDHLKSLNQDTNADSEQPISGLLKKFL